MTDELTPWDILIRVHHTNLSSGARLWFIKEFAAGKAPEEAWNACPDWQWLLPLLTGANASREAYRRLACEFAALALQEARASAAAQCHAALGQCTAFVLELHYHPPHMDVFPSGFHTLLGTYRHLQDQGGIDDVVLSALCAAISAAAPVPTFAAVESGLRYLECCDSKTDAQRKGADLVRKYFPYAEVADAMLRHSRKNY